VDKVYNGYIKKEWVFLGWLKNMRVTERLALLIAGLSVAILIVGGAGYFFLSRTSAAMETMYTDKLTAVRLINDSRAQTRKIESDTYALMLTTDEQENKALMSDITKRGKVFEENLQQFEQLNLSDEHRSRLKQVRDDVGKYRNVRDQVLKLAVQNKNAEAYTLFSKDGKVLADKFSDELGDLSDEITKSAEEMYQQGHHEAALANKVFIAVILAAILLGVLFGLLIARQIASRLNDVVKYLNILATGDFSKAISPQSLNDRSEFGTVSRAVETMKNNVKALIKHLMETSQQMAASSEELTASSEQSAQASNQVAGSVTEVAQGAEKQLRLTEHANNVVEQISSAITQVASNTEVVSNSAEKTANTANDGEDIIKQAIIEMKTIEEKTNATSSVIAELEEKSKQIGQIVDVISNISGQTNLLALNAAIEAARAGEAGRGFSVVAEEVRKLAEQSQEATKQITELINDVQSNTDSAVNFMNDGKQEVEAGAEIVAEAGKSFGEILMMVRDMSKQVHEISASIEEITSGTQNVVGAVQNINAESKKTSEQTQSISAATEEQSASVEEIASASQHLATMADDLQKAVQKFTI